MIINNNISALNTRNQLYNTNLSTAKNMEKLSSGKRINRAADDAAGLSISEKMRSQIRGLNQAARNAQDGISYIQTAEGALDEVSNMLGRLKTLAVQKDTGTYNSDDVTNIEKEVKDLREEISSVLTNTKFNEKQILAKSATTAASGATILIGNEATVTLKIPGLSTAAVTGILAVANTTGAAMTIAKVEAAIKHVNTARAEFGAKQNRLESTVRNLKTTSENLKQSESRIRDTDMAEEMSDFTKNNILVQAGTAMLAQANQQPQNVLSLLR